MDRRADWDFDGVVAVSRRDEAGALVVTLIGEAMSELWRLLGSEETYTLVENR